MDNIWHVDQWEPEKMIALYKAAGAKYFVAMANHHDNFDTWNSKYQPWNSVNIGPKKDIVGTWAKAARSAGLRFGVSVHASHTWNWWNDAQGADKSGPLAGVPYDGKLTKADGKGLWWDGYDPQDLYAQNHPVGGGDWEFGNDPVPPSKEYCEKFYNRTVDLIDQHNPDLLYFDDSGLPLHNTSDAGLRIASHYYNANIQRHGGKNEAILNTKGLDQDQRKCMVLDYERGRSDTIDPSPWQTDTCIGNWHYDRNLYDRNGYKTPEQVVRMLVDIVAKNGNLLLNIPVRGNGALDEKELDFLAGLTAWMKINDEAIFATRPWTTPGEGPVKMKAGGFSEGGENRLTEHDFRFTTKGNVLYATAMGWPDNGQYTVRTLGTNTTGLVGDVKKVTLLGNSGNLTFQRTADGLVVALPANKPCEHAWVLKIEGLDVPGSNPVLPPDVAGGPTIKADANGTLTLGADAATLQGSLHVENTPSNIGFWDNSGDTATWNVHIDSPGTYKIAVTASAQADSSIIVTGGAAKSEAIAIPSTGDWTTYKVFNGSITIPASGDISITVKAANSGSWAAINLQTVVLTRS
jgi:alpha-L-fucosidase